MTSTAPARVVPLPTGFHITLDNRTWQVDATTICGGQPTRVMRLSSTGVDAWNELRGGMVRSGPGAVLARRLTDAGLAHPQPPSSAQRPEVTVVIPVRDRHQMLARCLAALDRCHAVVVVDDGSVEPGRVASICTEHSARLVRRDSAGGPGAARNTGVAQVSSDVIAFLDSDCVPAAGWVDELLGHFGDPLVAAVAPRIVGLHARSRSLLDLGDREARVAPGSRVAYVPTAAVLVRRSALAGVSRDGEVFDTALRYGEDVDLVWRLHNAGWRIRYDPRTQVRHEEPGSLSMRFTRSFHYGSASAPLALRHPRSMAPVVVHPLPAVTCVALLAGRPAIAAIGFAATVVSMREALTTAGLPPSRASAEAVAAVRQSWVDISRCAVRFGAPLVASALVAHVGERRRGWGGHAAVIAVIVGAASSTWSGRRPAIRDVRTSIDSVVGDVAYGLGMFQSCLRAGTAAPLVPRVAWRLTRKRA